VAKSNLFAGKIVHEFVRMNSPSWQAYSLALIRCGCETKLFGRSAGLHPAGSRISNPQTFSQPGER